MKKIKEQKELLEIVSDIIEQQSHEIEVLRNIVKRYHLKYGEEVESGFIKIEDNEDILITEMAKVIICDSDKLSYTSNFQGIKELKRKLE